MKIVYLTDNTDFSELSLTVYDTKGQNKYGTMYMLEDKVEFVTSEQITDYFVFTSEGGKTFLCVKSPQLSNAFKGMTERFQKEQGFEFRPEKERFYIRMTPDQALVIPKNQKMNISVYVYGIFYQTSTKISFLQMEVSGFKAYPPVDFDAAFS